MECIRSLFVAFLNKKKIDDMPFEGFLMYKSKEKANLLHVNLASTHLADCIKMLQSSGDQPHPYCVSLSPGEKYEVPLSQTY
jgi:hypothetical protein